MTRENERNASKRSNNEEEESEWAGEKWSNSHLSVFCCISIYCLRESAKQTVFIFMVFLNENINNYWDGVRLVLAIAHNGPYWTTSLSFVFLSSFPKHHIASSNARQNKSKRRETILHPFHPFHLFYYLHSFIGAYKSVLRKKISSKIVHSSETSVSSVNHRLHNIQTIPISLASSFVCLCSFVHSNGFRSHFDLESRAMLHGNNVYREKLNRNWSNFFAAMNRQTKRK